MKNLISTFLFSFLSVCLSLAQNSAFTLSGNPNETFEGDSVTQYESKVKVTNMTSAPLSLTWQRVVIELPNGVTTQVCDKLNCYFPNVSTGTFTMDPSDADTFKIVYSNWGAACGNAFVHLVITNTNNPADVHTAMFNHHISCLSSGLNDLQQARIKVFPNPVSDYFVLENSDLAATLRVIDLTGRQVASFTASANQQYSTAALAAGTYIVVLEDAKGEAFQSTVLVK